MNMGAIDILTTLVNDKQIEKVPEDLGDTRDQVIASIAISLKRIADRLDQLPNRITAHLGADDLHALRRGG